MTIDLKDSAVPSAPPEPDIVMVEAVPIENDVTIPTIQASQVSHGSVLSGAPVATSYQAASLAHAPTSRPPNGTRSFARAILWVSLCC